MDFSIQIHVFLMWFQCFLFAVSSSSRIHILISYNGEWKQLRDHSGWTFTGKESKVLSVSREITYANLIDHLYDLLGYDRSKYDLVLKVVYQLGGGIIAPTVISNDEIRVSFWIRFLSQFSIGLLCVISYREDNSTYSKSYQR